MKKKPAKLSVKPIADLGDVTTLDQATQGARKDIPLPTDLSDRCYELAYFVANRTCAWYFARHEKGEELSEEHMALWNAAQYAPFQHALAISYHRGFRLALLRYADELKKSAEAAPILERLQRAAKKGGDARRAQAQPAHRAIRKRFKELRKTNPKKTARYLRVAEEFGISDRQVARIVDGLD
jgi:hypothetical protein